MNQQPQPLELHWKIMEFLQKLKNKTPVMVADLEDYYSLIQYLDRDITRLKESRDSWRKKYEELKKGVSGRVCKA